MTEAELVQHFWSAVENGISTLMLFVSLFTGYVIMAYLVGARLTYFQCLTATGAFLVFGSYCIWGSTVFWNSCYIVGLELHETRPELIPIAVNPAGISFAFLSVGILGALKFMWDIRHPKTE